MVRRFAAIHAGRSTASSGGSSAGTSSPLYSPTRCANSYARGCTVAARTPPLGGDPAIRSPTRCATPQSMASITPERSPTVRTYPRQVSASRIASAPHGPAGGKGRTEQLMERAEVRDVLAWLRLLVEPRDAAAVVRALARPPIELRQVHLARVIALARRRKLDLVAGLAAATESPQVPPEARERIQRFLALHRRAAAGLETLGPEVFVVSLIDMLQARGRALLAPESAAEHRASLMGLREVAARFARRSPSATPRELAAHLTAGEVAEDPPGQTEPAEQAQTPD